MSKFLVFFALLAAAIITGCGVQDIPDPDGTDWCYMYDFTRDQQGFLVTSGSHTAQGLQSDSTGLLQASYGYDRDVYPSYVIVTVVRPTGVVGDIQATAAGTAFGLSTYFSATMPADVNSAPLVFQSPTNGEEIIGDRNAINMTVDGSQAITVASIDIRGMGGSPFPSNPCSDSTPTPQPDLNLSLTPSGTPTATATGTAAPTVTGTLSPTPTPVMCDFNFLDDFVVNQTQPTWRWYVGEGYARGNINGHISPPVFNLPGTIDRVVFTFNRSWSGTLSFYSRITSGLVSTHSMSGSTWDVSGLSYNSAMKWDMYSVAEGNMAPSDVRVEHMTVYGSGCGSNTPTPTVSPTPGPTNTPGPTATPEPLWSQCIDFTTWNYQFTAVGAAYEDDSGFLQTSSSWRVGRSGLPATVKKKVKVVFNQFFAGDIGLSDNAVNQTNWKTVSGSTVVLDFTGESWLPTSTFWIEFQGGTPDTTLLQQICWADPNPSTPTPGPGTGTPGGTRTPLPTTTATRPPSTSIYIPPPVIYVTSTAGMLITSTPMWGGTPTYTLSGTPSLTGTPAGDGSGSGSGGVGGEAGEILGFGWQIGWGLFDALFAYMGQAGTMLTDIVTSFANATPQPLPGLPQCMSNPMAHDICAIYYILDFTIFSPGTAGALIIPLIRTLMWIYYAIYFIHYLQKVVDSGEDITNAP